MAGSFRIAEGFVEVTADETSFNRSMQRLQSRRFQVNVGVLLDDSAALARLRDLMRDRTTRLTADLDTRSAADDLALLTRPRTTRIRADADTSDAASRLDILTRDRHMNVRVDLDRSALSRLSVGGGGSEGGLGSLTSSLSGLVAAAIGALPTLASLGQAIIQMGPAAALAAPAVLSLGAAFAAVKLGTSGIGDAFKQAFAPATKSAGAAATATRQVESAARSLAKAQQAVKDAEVNAAAARVKAARDIRDAQLNLKNTVSDVADANRRAAESVASAERDLADAQKAAKQAQVDLTQARKAAAQELEDLNNRLADAQLDQRQKVLDLQDAEQQLTADKAAGSKVSAEQLAKDQLAYDRAVQALQEQQTETARLQQQTDDANKAGVDGSKTVTDAKQKIADANQQIKDKTQALKDAEIEAARAQVDGAQRVAKAQRDVADAQAAAAKAATDGARQIKDAQEAAAEAAQALAQAQNSGALATNKVADAMAKLAPSARAFVDAVLAQREAWRSLKLDVQNALFQGLGAKFTTMSTAILPSLRTGLVGTASILNRVAKNAADAVTNLGKSGQLRQLFDGLNDGMRPLTRIPGQIITGLTQISIAASPAFARLATAAAGAADRISQKLSTAFKSGAMETAINNAVGIAKQFGKLFADAFATLGNIFKAAAAGGGNALGMLGSVFAELRRITAMPEVQKALTSIFTAINSIAKLLAGTLGKALLPLIEGFGKIAPTITTVVDSFSGLAPVIGGILLRVNPLIGGLALIAPILGKLAGPISGLIKSIAPILQTVADFSNRIITAIAPVLGTILKVLGAAFTALSPVVTVVLDVVAMLVEQFATALTPVIGALVPIVQQFGRFIGQLAPLFPALFQAIMPLIPPLAQLTVSLLNLAMQVIEPLLPLIVGLAQLLTGVLASAITTLVPGITMVIGWLTKFTDAVTNVVKWIVDKFTWLYDVLVGHSIIPDLVKAIVGYFTGLWSKTKQIFTDLKNGVVAIWNSLWKAVSDKWSSFWGGFRSAFTGAWKLFRDSVTNLRTSITGTWASMWNGARDKVTSIFSTINSKISSFKNGMKNAFSSLRDSLGTIWKGIQSKIGDPVKWVISHVYNSGIRKMWNSIAGKISSKISLPAISLGFSEGGVVPGKRSNRDSVPAMLAPGERVLSNAQVDSLGGHRAIDAMLGKDRPTRTGGNPTSQQERRRHQATQGFADGGIIGKVTGAIGGAVGSVASWAKDVVVGGLKAAAQKALSALVRPLINSIPGSGIGNLMRGLSNKAVDGILGWLGNEDKKAVGGPAVQRALAWAKTQNGKPYQWGGNNNPSFDCSGFMSAIESVIRGEKPHRRWATGSFPPGAPGWVRNLNSPFMIGITNAGVGHTAGTLAGVNVESRGGDGIVVGKRARGYNNSLFTSRWGFAPAAKFDSGGLLQPGATMAINKTGKPEAVLTAEQTAALQSLSRSGGSVVIENITVSGTFDFSKPSAAKQAARQLVVAVKEELRNYDRGRAR